MSGPEILIHAFNSAGTLEELNFDTAYFYVVCIVLEEQGPYGDWKTFPEEMYETENMHEAIQYASTLSNANNWPIADPWCHPDKWASNIIPVGPKDYND